MPCRGLDAASHSLARRRGVSLPYDRGRSVVGRYDVRVRRQSGPTRRQASESANDPERTFPSQVQLWKMRHLRRNVTLLCCAPLKAGQSNLTYLHEVRHSRRCNGLACASPPWLLILLRQEPRKEPWIVLVGNCCQRPVAIVSAFSRSPALAITFDMLLENGLGISSRNAG